ncbi:MAG: DUF389 domain-containing protein, partial [Bacteroidetes bacterium]|nr:DUF389 domain-containing protein [Bacteroidota bacterium]
IIALFGGFAGIIATCSKKKGNVLPGAAIATALMPPLCTVGYGLATWQPAFFGGAFYLFAINSVFIALSAMIVSYALKMPARGFVTNMKKKQARVVIYSVIILTFIPSLFYGLKLVKRENFNSNAQRFVQEVAFVDDHLLLKHSIDDLNFRIDLIYGGGEFNENTRKNILTKAKKANIDPKSISILQGLQTKNYDNEFDNLNDIQFKISDLTSIIDRQNQQIDSLKFGKIKLSKNLIDSIHFNFPEIIALDLNEKHLIRFDTTLVVKNFQLTSNKVLKSSRRDSIVQLIKLKLPKDSLKVSFSL